MSFTVVIPARYASTRLPGKVLLDIGGKTMLQRVFDNAARSGAERVIVATDDEAVARVASDFGASVRMTSTRHSSGTERVAEVIEMEGIPADHVVVNVQADEPFMPPQLIGQVADGLGRHPDCRVATLCEPIRSRAMLLDPNAVKVVRDHAGRALYFSRAPIPWPRDEASPLPEDSRSPPLHHRHVGIYAYRAGYVARYLGLPRSPLEVAESLEQLRVLEAGERIYVAVAELDPGPGVDSEEDLIEARRRAAAGAEKTP